MTGTYTPDTNIVSIKDGWFIKNNDHQNKFNILGGIITGCKIETHQSKEGAEYEFIKLELEDTDGKFSLSLPIFNNLGRSFMLYAPNIDLSKMVELYVSLDQKGYSQLFLKQDGKYLKYYFTKDDPKGMPDFEIIGGKWNNAKQIKFLKSALYLYIIQHMAIEQSIDEYTEEEIVPDFVDPFDPFAL